MKSLKKVLSIFMILALAAFVVACKDTTVDPAQTKLDAAYDALNGVISDASNVKSNLTLPVSLSEGDVTAVWTSNEPGVASVGTPADGTVVVTINRPAKGSGNANVTLTAKLSIQSEQQGKELTKNWVKDITVVENEVADLVIESIADILAITDPAYDGGVYNVTLNGVTIFATGGASVAFGYDGTGVIQLYGISTTFAANKVYTVSGNLEWYYGIWEITSTTTVEEAGATPKYPSQETVASVTAKIAELAEDRYHITSSGTAADGNMEAMYVKVTGKVYIVPEDTSSYNTFIVDTAYDTTQKWPGGNETTPAPGFLVYYGTEDFALLKLYDGIIVTIDAVIYTHRSNNRAFAIYYVGGPEGVQATLTDAQKQKIDADAITLPNPITTATTIDLVEEGANGSTIAWSFKSTTDENNQYVDLASGAVTMPQDKQVIVNLVATVSYGSLTAITREFALQVGEYPLSTINEAKQAKDGDTVKVVGIVTAITATGNYWIQDATGGINVYVPTAIQGDFKYVVGDTLQITAELDIYNGLFELVNFAMTDVKKLTGSAALEMPAATDISEVAVDDLLDHQGKLVDLKGYVLKSTVTAATSSFNFTLVNKEGREFSARVVNTASGFADLVTALNGKTAGTAIDLEGVILGWYNGPQLAVSVASSVKAGTAYSDADLAAAAAALLSVPEENADITENLTLPATGLFGSTVTWTSSNTDVIALDGTVTRPAIGAADVEVTLGYTVKVNDATTTKVDIVVTVKAQSAAPEPQTVTLAYTTDATTNMGDGVNEASAVGLNPAIFTVVGDKNGGGNNIGLNKGGWLAFYYLSGGNGCILTVTIAEGYEIQSIQFTYKMNNTTNQMILGVNGTTVNLDSTQTATQHSVIAINGSTVTIQNKATGNTQFHLVSMIITYVEKA